MVLVCGALKVSGLKLNTLRKTVKAVFKMINVSL